MLNSHFGCFLEEFCYYKSTSILGYF